MTKEAKDIDVAHELVNLHFHVHRLQVLLNTLLNKCIKIGVEFTPEEIFAADHQAFVFAQSKFPDREITMPSTIQDNKPDA